MLAHVMTVAGYVVSTLLVQGTSHFAINADHYSGVQFARTEPVFALGLLAMVVQGSVISWIYSRFAGRTAGLLPAMSLAWAMGAFLVSYIAFGQAGEFSVPDIASWITVEIAVGFVQFTLVGLVLWLAHHRLANRRSATA